MIYGPFFLLSWNHAAQKARRFLFLYNTKGRTGYAEGQEFTYQKMVGAKRRDRHRNHRLQSPLAGLYSFFKSSAFSCFRVQNSLLEENRNRLSSVFSAINARMICVRRSGAVPYNYLVYVYITSLLSGGFDFRLKNSKRAKVVFSARSAKRPLILLLLFSCLFLAF